MTLPEHPDRAAWKAWYDEARLAHEEAMEMTVGIELLSGRPDLELREAVMRTRWTWITRMHAYEAFRLVHG